jgi:hypothetical protein
MLLVKGGLLPAPTHKIPGDAYANVVPRPGSFKRPQCHHDLWFAKREWFAAHGLDVNNTAYLRWVEGTPHGGTPGNWQFHQDWHGDFEDDWTAFINAENPEIPYTESQILQFMTSLRASYPAKGKRP